MPYLGAEAMIDLVLPTGIDASKILQWQLEDGMSAVEVLGLTAAAVGAANTAIQAKFGNMTFLTDEAFTFYAQGEADSGMTPRRREFGRTSGVRASEIGHMLPREDYTDALSWTPLYLRRTRRGKVETDLKLITDRWLNRVNFDIYTRMLTNTENAIGAAGYDVPWAIGTGTNVNYIPPQYGAKKFTSSHTHFLFANTSSSGTYATLLNAMVTELKHHGIFGRPIALISGDAVDTVSALEKFVALEPAGVTVVAGNANAPIRIVQGEFQAMPGELFGYFKSSKGLIELRYDDYMPDGYTWMTQSYGVNDRRNGIAIREEPGVGFGLRPNPQVTTSINPELDYVQFEATHGVGTNQRLNGVAGKIGAGVTSYTNPTLPDTEAPGK